MTLLNLTFSKTSFEWIIYSHFFSLTLILIFVILLGIFLKNRAKYVKFLNLISAYYLIIFFINSSLDIPYEILVGKQTDLNFDLIMSQNTTLFPSLFIFIATITVFLFFLGISNIFFIEENAKFEFSLLVWFIYISAVFLISTTDFISVIILLECIAFSSYVLVGFERKNKFSASSALKYLILASIPSGLFILGISLFYNVYGTFSQKDLKLLFEFMAEMSGDCYKSYAYVSSIYGSFIDYLSALNAYFSEASPKILPLLYTYEYYLSYFLVNCSSIDTLETKVDWEFFNLETSQYDIHFFNKMKNAYTEVLNLHLYVIRELYTAQDFFNFTTQQNIVKDPYSFFSKKFTSFENLTLFQSKGFLNLLQWFGVFSFAEYIRTLLVVPTPTQNLVLNVFAVQKFQFMNIQNIIYNSDIFTFNLNVNISHAKDIYIKSVLVAKRELFEQMNRYLIILLDESNLSAIEKSNFLLDSQKNSLYVPHPNDPMFSAIINWKVYENHTELNTLLERFADANIRKFFSESVSENVYFPALTLAFIFITANLFFKITAAPFHVWAPSVYGGSPLATLTFLSIFSKLTIIFFMIWLFLNICENFKFIWQPIFLIVSFLSVFISILGAFSEKNLKRFFVYSSVGHVGFMLAGLFVLNLDGIRAVIDYMILYIISSLIIWFIIMHLNKKTITLVNLKGLSLNQPFLGLIFSIVMFSLSGLPPFGGFFVKYEIFYSLIQSSFFYFAYILLILTVVSFFYYLRVIKIIYFENNKTFIKNKNLDDIKLRLIAFSFFLIPFFMLFIENPILYFVKNILIESLR